MIRKETYLLNDAKQTTLIHGITKLMRNISAYVSNFFRIRLHSARVGLMHAASYNQAGRETYLLKAFGLLVR